MKKWLLFILILTSLKVFPQKSYIISGNYYAYDGIIKVDSTVKKDQLYSLGLVWFANIYNNSKFVIQMQDKDAGIIIGKAGFSTTVNLGALVGSNTYFINYTIKLSFKDGKLKYDLYDFINTDYDGLIKDGKIIQYVEPFGHGIKDKGYKGIQKAVANNTSLMIDNLTNYFKNSITKTKDW